MSGEKDVSAPRDTGDKARRTYASLECARGFIREGKNTVSICPMDRRTYWVFVGSSSPTAKDAQYEKVD